MTSKIPLAIGVRSTIELTSFFTFQELPREIQFKILCELTASEAAIAGLVCRDWSVLLGGRAFWKFLLKRDFQRLKTKQPKELYQKCHRIYRNLVKGIYSTRLVQPSIGESNCFCVKGRKLVLGSCRGKIEIWDLETGTCENSFSGHRGSSVSLLHLANEWTLISGSLGGSIAIWNLKTGRCEKRLFGHQPIEFLIPTREGKLISGAKSQKIDIWDLKSEVCERTLEGHQGGTMSLCLTLGDKLISGGCDCKIKIWDLKTGICEKTLIGHQRVIESLCLVKDNTLISGSLDFTIKVWDLEKGICIKTLEGHCSAVCSLILTNERELISGSDDGMIMVWDLDTWVCQRVFGGNEYDVTSLCLTEGDKLISASDLGRAIKIWDLRSGICEMTFRDAERIPSLTLTSDAKLITGLKVLDFNSSNAEIFEELADMFETHARDPQAVMLAMERFSRMPEGERRQIYGELFQILNMTNADDALDAEYAFHDERDLALLCKKRHMQFEITYTTKTHRGFRQCFSNRYPQQRTPMNLLPMFKR